MKSQDIILICCYSLFVTPMGGQTFPDSLLVSISGGTFTMGESEDDYEGPPGTYDSFIHTVTVSSFQMSATEITNQQYVDFLNASQGDGLVEVRVETNPGPDLGNSLVYGTGQVFAQTRKMVLLR